MLKGRFALTGLLRPLWPGAMALLLAACAGDPGQGPVDVEWGHEACQRCRMILENSAYAAQVRWHQPGEPSKVYLFDDLGCALIWLQDQPWKDDPVTEIWVSDHETNAWLDARKAHYVTGQQTPMLYGLGARAEPAAGSLDFAAAQAHVFAVERRLNQHRAH